MALKKKSSNNDSLRSKAKDSANVILVRGDKSRTPLKEGTFADISEKKRDSVRSSNNQVVGISVGCTKNMDNFESLRVDVWLSDSVQSGETVEEAYDRVRGVIDETLSDIVESYIES